MLFFLFLLLLEEYCILFLKKIILVDFYGENNMSIQRGILSNWEGAILSIFSSISPLFLRLAFPNLAAFRKVEPSHTLLSLLFKEDMKAFKSWVSRWHQQRENCFWTAASGQMTHKIGPGEAADYSPALWNIISCLWPWSYGTAFLYTLYCPFFSTVPDGVEGGTLPEGIW